MYVYDWFQPFKIQKFSIEHSQPDQTQSGKGLDHEETEVYSMQ